MVEEGREQEDHEEHRRDDQEDQGREETAEDRGLRGTLDSARQAFTRSFDRLTGTQFRRQFEEFTNVVTTTILGIHRDQLELRERLERVGHSTQAEPSTGRIQKLVIWAFIFSLVAVILGVVALVRTL